MVLNRKCRNSRSQPEGRRNIRMCRSVAQLRAGTKDGRHSAPSHRAILAFPTKKSGGWLSIVAIIVQFREKKVYFAGHFVITAFVFIDIPGGSFIFNISRGQSPV